MTMIVSEIAIFAVADGSLAVLGPASTPLRSGQGSVPLPADYSPETWKWDATKRMMYEVPALVEAVLVGKVKSTNEALVKTAYSQNYGKQKKYSRKQQEVLDFRALTPALGTLTDVLSAPLSAFVPNFASIAAAPRRKKFRFAMAQAAKRGVPVDVIIAEFEGAIETNEDRVANWEAVELEAIRAIKAATTAAAKRAAYAAINWNWTA